MLPLFFLRLKLSLLIRAYLVRTIEITYDTKAACSA